MARSVPSASAATGKGRAAEGFSAEASAGLRLIATAGAGAARWVDSTGLETCSASVLAASSSRQDATSLDPFSIWSVDLAVRRACYGVVRFIMENGAKGCEVIISGKLRAQRAKAMKFKDGYLISTGEPKRHYISE